MAGRDLPSRQPLWDFEATVSRGFLGELVDDVLRYSEEPGINRILPPPLEADYGFVSTEQGLLDRVISVNFPPAKAREVLLDPITQPVFVPLDDRLKGAAITGLRPFDPFAQLFVLDHQDPHFTLFFQRKRKRSREILKQGLTLGGLLYSNVTGKRNGGRTNPREVLALRRVVGAVP